METTLTSWILFCDMLQLKRRLCDEVSPGHTATKARDDNVSKEFLLNVRRVSPGNATLGTTVFNDTTDWEPEEQSPKKLHNVTLKV